jgi:hypothetical protein
VEGRKGRIKKTPNYQITTNQQPIKEGAEGNTPITTASAGDGWVMVSTYTRL